MVAAEPLRANRLRWQQLFFRTLACYWGLYAASLFSMLGMNVMPFPELVAWFGHNVLGIEAEISAVMGPSGDTMFFWVQVALMLVASLVLAVGWTLLDRASRHDAFALDAVRVLVRFTLAFMLMGYGSNKLRQFPPLSLGVLVTPFGQLSPEGVLWTFMMASPAYSLFAGFVEMAGALLLLPRRTATLGAVVCAGSMANVVMLNFAYNVPVKLLSSHLLVMAAFLVATDARRLANVFLFNRPTESVSLSRIWPRPWMSRLATVAKAILVIAVVSRGAQKLYLGIVARTQFVAKSPLHGIWEVETFTAEGSLKAPLTPETTRWETVLVSGARNLTVLRKGGEGSSFRLQMNEADQTLTLGAFTRDGEKPVASLKYSRPSPAILELNGSFEDRVISVRLLRVDEQSLPINSGIHLITAQRPMR